MNGRRLLKLVSHILFLLLLFTFLLAPAAAQEPAVEGDVAAQTIAAFSDIFLSPDPVNVPVDAIGALEIEVEDAANVFGFTLTMNYDGNDVQIVPGQVNPGSLLPGTRGVDYFMTVTQPFPTGAELCGNSVLVVTVTYLNAAAGPIQGSGPVVELPVKGKTIGLTDVCLNGAQSDLTDLSGLGFGGLPDSFAGVDVIAADFLRITLQGGKWTDPRPVLGGVHSLEVEVNNNPVIVVDASENAYALVGPGPYDSIEVSRPGYLSASISDNEDELPLVDLLAGDVNLDDKINIFDLVLMAQNYWGATVTPTSLPQIEAADFDDNGTVGLTDLVLAANNFGKSGPIVLP